MKEVNPKETTRAYAFEMWMNAPMPMVTFFKTLNVSRLVRISRRSGLKFNMLMCWCIGKAASRISEFYLLPVGDKLLQYDRLAVNTIVANRTGEVSSCDLPLHDDLLHFNLDYLRLTHQVAQTCCNHDLPDCMVIGTSALVGYEIDGAVGMYSGVFNNPFLIWGSYKRHWLRTTLTMSFQFHHTQSFRKESEGVMLLPVAHLSCHKHCHLYSAARGKRKGASSFCSRPRTVRST